MAGLERNPARGCSGSIEDNRPLRLETYMVETVQPTSDTRETSRLISSEKVESTSVENTRGDNLGHIEES
jgi:hypothetical protein